MSVSSIATFGSAAIATPPPPTNANAVKSDDKANPVAPPPVEAAKAPGIGLLLDKTV